MIRGYGKGNSGGTAIDRDGDTEIIERQPKKNKTRDTIKNVDRAYLSEPFVTRREWV